MVGRPLSVWALAVTVLALTPTASAFAAGTSGVRDGAHDFDFNIGKWHTHIRHVIDPLSKTPRSVILEGTVTGHRLWSGPGQIEEIEADGPDGAHLEGMTLFLYDSSAGQWSQAFASSKSHVIDAPMIGAFKDGRGEFIGTDVVKGRTVLLRGVWSNFTLTSHHFEEDYSDDGGRTWAPAFVADLTKVPS